MSRLQPPRSSGLQKPGSTTASSPGRGSLLTRPSTTAASSAARGRGIGLGLARGPSGSSALPGSSSTTSTNPSSSSSSSATRRSNPASPGTTRAVPGAHRRSPSMGAGAMPRPSTTSTPATRRLGPAKGRSTPVPYQVNERVRVETLSLEGTVRYLGPTHFKPGTWAGLELDEEGTGKNDGSVGGEAYFSCPPATGIFVLVSKLSKLDGEPDPAIKSNLSSSSKPGVTRRSSSISSSSSASTSLQFRPESRAGRFVGMTAQQYKRASLLNGSSGKPSSSSEDSALQGPGMSPSRSLPSKSSPTAKSGPSAVLAAARSRISTTGSRSTINGTTRSTSGSSPSSRPGIPGSSSRAGMHQRTVSQSTRKSTSTVSSTSSSPQRRRSLNQPRTSGPLSPQGSKSLISPPPSSIQEHTGSSNVAPITSSPSSSSGPGSPHLAATEDSEEGQRSRDQGSEYAEKLQARLSVLEAENRLLRVQGEQTKARLVATELLDKGTGSAGQSGEDSTGVGSAEIAQLRARVTQLLTERDLASEERDALQKRLVGMQRPSTVLSGIKSSSRGGKDGEDEDEEDEHEQVLRLTERVREGDERVRALEEALESARAGVVGEEMAGRLRSLEEALADAESLLSSKGDEERNLRERLEELEREVAFHDSSRPKKDDPSSSSSSKREGEGQGGEEEEGGHEELKALLEEKIAECGQLSARLDRLATEGERDRSVLVAQVEGLRAAGMETITLYEGKIASLESRLALHGSERGQEEEGKGREGQGEEGGKEEGRMRPGAEGDQEHGRGQEDPESGVEAERDERRQEEMDRLRERLKQAEREMEELKEMHELRMEELRLELAQASTDQIESAETGMAEERERLDRAREEKDKEMSRWEEEVQRAKEEGDQLRQALTIAQESVEKERLEREVKEEELRLELEEALEKLRKEMDRPNSSSSPTYSSHIPEKEGEGKEEEEEGDKTVTLAALQAKLNELQEEHQAALEENESLQAAQENLVEAHRQVENECFKLMDEVERLHSESLLATPVGPEEDAGIRVVERDADKTDESDKEGSEGAPRADPTVVAAVNQGAEAVQRLLTEKQRQLEGRERAFREEILRLTRRVATLERERVDEVGARERDIADLESLVEAKIFREADLEEQVERGAKQIRELQQELEGLKGSGLTSPESRKVSSSSHRSLGQGSARGDDPSSPVPRPMRSRSSSLSSAALYCELCEVDGHEITSCPAVLGTGAPTPPRISTYSYGSEGSDAEGAGQDESMNVDGLIMDGDGSFVYGGAGDDDEEFDKPYCENCEEFGAHWTEDCPEGDATY
ncbi:MAG: hypothetical protein DHS80DRAFT_20987 [Piptocephalis tieghemiana]|nr:MAG: hypothetical protein DHS80DRAFT_20987 [Piptocephalis tieghemiana]